MRSTEAVASPVADLAGVEEEAVAVVIVVTAVTDSRLPPMEAADSEAVLDSNSNSRLVSNSMTIQNVRYATDTIQEVHEFAGGVMKKTTRKKSSLLWRGHQLVRRQCSNKPHQR